MKQIFFLILSLFSIHSAAQNTEEQAVIKAIETMFDGMRESDSTKLLSVVYEGASLKTTFINKSGVPTIHEGNMEEFASSIAKPHEEIYDEKIWSYEIEIDGVLATAWTEYTFYLGKSMSHCGVNAFQLFKSASGWKIISITDTRRRDKCQTEPSKHEERINVLLDEWHMAAAKADEVTFFDKVLSDDAIYLGTDASERWGRDEMKTLMKEVFERETAWAFTKKERFIYFSNDGKTAWFEELLDTWMGDCRGSGVLELTSEGWKLKHYNLAMLVPNDKVKSYLELLKKE